MLDLRREGTTVLFSTHDMGMAEKLCDFVCMIYQGRRVLDGTLEAIQDQYGTDVVRVRFDGEAQGLAALGGVRQVKDLGRWKELQLATGTDPQQTLAALMTLGRLRHFEVARPSLQDIFVQIAGAKVAENGHA
jgi:ABC-2 type transport system ATP-binding protein